MISAKVNVVSGWGHELARRVNRAAAVATQEAIEDGAEVARQKAQTRRRSGDMADIQVEAVRGTPTGWEASFRSTWYARFQSKGTKTISALGFLEDGAKEAKRSLRRRLDRISSRR